MTRARLIPGALVAAALTLAACSGVQAPFDAAGDQAAHIKDIWHLMLVVCGVMYALVLAFLAAAIWRSRRALAGPPVAEGYESAAERPMQKTLIGWSVLIVLGLAVLAVGSFMVDRRLALADIDNALHIKITANQWWWQVEYQDPVAQRQVVTANELHLPAGRPVVIELQSQDVIHSFWIPNLAGKMDLIPGRTNTLAINPRRVGEYRGQCAEFCGLQHAQMALDATVESPAAFAAWYEAGLKPGAEPTTPQQVRGRDLFLNTACAGCHAVNGTDAGGQTGPDLTHLASRKMLAAGALPMSRDALTRWLHDPQAIKPGNHMPVVDMAPTDQAAVVAYLESLK